MWTKNERKRRPGSLHWFVICGAFEGNRQCTAEVCVHIEAAIGGQVSTFYVVQGLLYICNTWGSVEFLPDWTASSNRLESQPQLSLRCDLYWSVSNVAGSGEYSCTLCRSALRPGCWGIGLNVKSDTPSALHISVGLSVSRMWLFSERGGRGDSSLTITDSYPFWLTQHLARWSLWEPGDNVSIQRSVNITLATIIWTSLKRDL